MEEEVKDNLKNCWVAIKTKDGNYSIGLAVHYSEESEKYHVKVDAEEQAIEVSKEDVHPIANLSKLNIFMPTALNSVNEAAIRGAKMSLNAIAEEIIGEDEEGKPITINQKYSADLAYLYATLRYAKQWLKLQETLV